MQRRGGVDQGSTVAVREPVDMLEKKVIKLHWNDSRPRRETLEVTFADSPLPPLTQSAPDIRAFAGPEWRDQVRRMYDFARLKLNFQSIRLNFQESGEEDECDLLEGDRNEVQEVVNRLDEEAFERIRFKTRDATECEVIEEHRDVPSVLQSYVMADAQGVVATVRDPDTSQDDPERVDAAAVDESDAFEEGSGVVDERAHAEFVEQCREKVAARTGRRRDPTAGPGNPDPD